MTAPAPSPSQATTPEPSTAQEPEGIRPSDGLEDLFAPEPQPEPVPEPIQPEPPPTHRTWKTADGSFSVEAEYVYFGNGKVKLRRLDNGKEILVEREILSDDDKAWIDERRRSSPQQDVVNHRINLANYNQITKGMPRAQVFKILGMLGSRQHDDVDNRDGTRSQLWSWRKADLESCNIIFRDDVVLTKTQYGLK